MQASGLERDRDLARRLGAGGLAAAVFNTVVGSGIFIIPATLARDLGPAAPLAYLACLIAMGAVSLCFAAAGSRAPVSGGPYGYAEAAFGPMAAFVIGVLLWLGAVLAAAGIATAVVDGLSGYIPALAGPAARAATLVAIFAVLGAVNVAGVASGVRAVSLLTVAKLAPLLLLVAVCAPHLHPSALRFSPPPASAFGRAMILALFAFQGMETALGVSGEVRRPERNVPLGLLAAMAGVAALYVLVQPDHPGRARSGPGLKPRPAGGRHARGEPRARRSRRGRSDHLDARLSGERRAQRAPHAVRLRAGGPAAGRRGRGAPAH